MKIQHVLLPLFLRATVVSIAVAEIIYDDDCPLVTWDPNIPETCPAPLTRPRFTRPPTTRRPRHQAGDIHCRYRTETYANGGAHACRDFVDKYHIELDKFFVLNPELGGDCGNFEPRTTYCVAGFIEPLRAYDGLCGPPNGGATCIGVDAGQCCNSEMWTCGDSEVDCAPGICYEGVCHGHKVYTTDGKCGHAHGGRLCAGKWGDCCSIHGECGTGEDFCGKGVCSLGNCAEAIAA